MKFQFHFDGHTFDCSLFCYHFSELKRRMKAEKKAAEKETKIKEQQAQKKETNDQGAQSLCALDEETLDPNVRFLYGHYTSHFTD